MSYLLYKAIIHNEDLAHEYLQRRNAILTCFENDFAGRPFLLVKHGGKEVIEVLSPSPRLP